MKKKGALNYKFMNKYEVDFWGYLTSCSNGKRFFKKMFKLFCFKYRYQIRFLKFLYKKPYIKFNYPRIMQKKKRRKLYVKNYIVRLHDLLRFRVYYGDMTIKKFRKYLQKVNSRRLDFESKICFLLESRLDILLFRLNLVKNPREARQYIKNKKIKVNDNIVNKINYQLYINDVITFDKELSTFFFKNLLLKLRKKKVLFNYPRYLEMNYKLMKCIFISYPLRKFIPSTWKFDLSFLQNFIRK
jgi:ribosomal protein S4